MARPKICPLRWFASAPLTGCPFLDLLLIIEAAKLQREGASGRDDHDAEG